jgi:hypothetical protein
MYAVVERRALQLRVESEADLRRSPHSVLSEKA